MSYAIKTYQVKVYDYDFFYSCEKIVNSRKLNIYLIIYVLI